MSYASTLLRRKLRDLALLPEEQDVPSPCISVCRMNEGTGWCDGCFRTLDEIADWAAMDRSEKRVVWDSLGRRALASTSCVVKAVEGGPS